MKKFTFLLIAFTRLFLASSDAQVSCPANVDFEAGDYSAWKYYIGSCCTGGGTGTLNTPLLVSTPPVATYIPCSFALTGLAAGGSVAVTGVDPFGGFPVVFAGNYSLRVGSTRTASWANRAEYTVHVPAGYTNYSLIYRYAVVLEDPGHSANQQPRFTVTATDSNSSTAVPCVLANYVAGALPGFVGPVSNAFAAIPTYGCPDQTGSGIHGHASTVYYKPWATASINLAAYAGHTVLVDFTSGDCQPAGHFGYGYVDMSCGLFAINTYLPPCGATTAQMIAPTGFTSYAWYDSATFSTLYGTTDTITIPAPSVQTTYAIILTPPPGFGCTDTLYTTLNPTSCSGIPIPGIVNTTAMSACVSTPFTLTNSGYTCTGFQWQSSPDSLTWSNIIAATNAVYTAPGITATTYFRCKDSCCVSGLTAATPGIKITHYACCSGTPAAGAATASTTYCSSCSLTLNLTSFTYVPGMAYQWQYSPDNISWTNLPGAVTLPYTFTPFGACYYRCVVTCSAFGTSAHSAAVFVGYQYHITADSVTNTPDTICNPPRFYVKVNGTSTLLRLKTYYGDGTHDSVAFVASGTTSSASPSHAYTCAGDYTVKQIVYYNNTLQDSIKFNYQYNYCNVFSFRFYYDVNNDCINESTESYNGIPILVQVDSAGIPIDTLSVTTGLYYQASGGTGTVYSFQLLPGSAYVSCPAPGIWYDTIHSVVNNYPARYISLGCGSSGTAFDLAVNAAIIGTGVHQQAGYIYVRNNSCNTTNATVTLHYSTQYSLASSPHSSSPGIITWNLTGLSANTPAPAILFYQANQSPNLPLGDTVHEYITVTPTSGDADTFNNYFIKEDTTKSGYDPNLMLVSPECSPVDTTLQYTIHFENTGNDTAHNIHVMDTLSNNVDIHTLTLLTASANMDIEVFNDGVHNIAKFDFPGINLLDSSHHGLCDGAVFFTIKNKSGLAYGTTIANRAGIYFDDNPVVMTNSAITTKGCPSPLVVHSINNTHSIQLYPNPAHTTLTITSSENINSIIITNIIGQTVYTHEYSAQQVQINIAGLPNGIYFVKVNNTEVRKFVKE